MTTRTVRGEVVVPPGVGPLRAQRLVVEVSDVSLADAASVPLGSVELTDLDVAGGTRIPFVIDGVPEGAPRARLAVRAHVDVAGTRGFSGGDLLTTQHVAVPPAGDVAHLEVPVAPI